MIDLPGFRAWTDYWGPLDCIDEPNPLTGAQMQTQLYGFENISDPTNVTAEVPSGRDADVPDMTCYGYVMGGGVNVWDGHNHGDGVVLKAGRWFCFPSAIRMHLHPGTRVVVCAALGYLGLRSFGGPLERAGRLRYIDGCSDTILAMPPVLGDPVLNHLHFPSDTVQTMHQHPSVRCGAIAGGAGDCRTPDGIEALEPGMIWLIPAGSDHLFSTMFAPLDVVAFHPDSDWGPTDDDHPMLNRTWVDGRALHSDRTAQVIR